MKFNFRLEDIKYSKIHYQNKLGNYLVTRAAIKRIDAREILACARFHDEPDIQVPQTILLSIVCNDGIYKTKTTLKSCDNEEPYILFVLETPKEVEHEQNREYFRVATNYDCVYTIEQDGEQKEFSSKTVDISANGVSIILPTPLVSNNITNLTINIENKHIPLKVRFVRSEKLTEGYKGSFSFIGISDSDRDYISQVCLKKQLQERRNSIR